MKNHPLNCLIVLSTLMPNFGATCGIASGQTDIAAVKREIALSQARHLEIAEHVQIDYVQEHYDELNNAHMLISKVHSRLRRCGQRYLAEERVEILPPPGLKTLIPRRKSQVISRSTNYGFELLRSGGTDNWHIKNIHILGSPDPIPKNLQPDLLKNGTRFTQPFTLRGDALLTEMMNSESFRIVKCSPSSKNPSAIQIQFEDSPKPVGKGETPSLTGWFDLDPTTGWSLRESEITIRSRIDRETIRAKNQSTIDSNGFVRISKEERSFDIEKGGVVTARRSEVLNYRLWLDRDVPEIDFCLTAYGLPEPPGITVPSRPTPTYVWMLLAAGGLGILALASRWLLKRRTKAVPPTAPE